MATATAFNAVSDGMDKYKCNVGVRDQFGMERFVSCTKYTCKDTPHDTAFPRDTLAKLTIAMLILFSKFGDNSRSKAAVSVSKYAPRQNKLFITFTSEPLTSLS
jgi:hypothetical protein